jgi:general secretion pathway protein D
MKVFIFGFLVLFFSSSIYANSEELVNRFKSKGVAVDKSKMKYGFSRGKTQTVKSLNAANYKKLRKDEKIKKDKEKEKEKDAKSTETKNTKSSNTTINNGGTSYRYDNSKTVKTKVNGEMVSSPIMTPIPDPIVHLKKIESGAKINLDYNEVELGDIIKYISDITDTNFIVPSNLKGKKITIISPQKVTPSEALSAFFTVLTMNNFSVVKSGKYYQILPIREANKPNFLYYQSQRVPDVDYLVTKIYNLKYAKLRDVENLINKLKSTNGNVSSYEPTSMIIYTDSGVRINSTFKIIKQIDVPVDSVDKIWLVPIYYSEARDLAQKIEEIFDLKNNRNNRTNNVQNTRLRSNNKSKVSPVKANTQAEEQLELNIDKVLYDERTNQLIIKSDEASKMKLIDLIKKLDIPLEDDSTIHVYYLKNAKAEDIASTINSLSSGSSARKTNSARRAQAGGSSTSSLGGVMFQGEVKVTADKSTNTLVVVASAKDYNALRKVIELLDLKRKQVYVEAVIMEISVDKDRQVGLSANGGYETNVSGTSVPVFSGTNFGDLSSIAINPAALTGFAFGAMTDSINITDNISVPSFGVILKALETNNDVNVLSSPQVLTMDNEEAEFIVGENVPFPSGISNALSGTTGSSSYLPVVSIQRQDVAIKLKIKPQISGDNQVKLEVNQEITEVKSIDPIKGPTTSKRQVKTTVVVPDQQTVVIGGLIKDNTTVTENKVPILGDIPVLGFFFKYKSNRVSKSNLLVFLTPYIVRDSKDMNKIWNKKMADFEEFKRLKTRINEGMDIFIDYSKKRGVVSEINFSLNKFEGDIKLNKDLNGRSNKKGKKGKEVRAQNIEPIQKGKEVRAQNIEPIQKGKKVKAQNIEPIQKEGKK